jgi:hypothetical protein
MSAGQVKTDVVPGQQRVKESVIGKIAGYNAKPGVGR